MVEALREIVEEVLLPTHSETMSDEVGVEITRPVRSATLLPTRYVRSKMMDGAFVPRPRYVPYIVKAWIVPKPYGTVRSATEPHGSFVEVGA